MDMIHGYQLAREPCFSGVTLKALPEGEMKGMRWTRNERHRAVSRTNLGGRRFQLHPFLPLIRGK